MARLFSPIVLTLSVVLGLAGAVLLMLRAPELREMAAARILREAPAVIENNSAEMSRRSARIRDMRWRHERLTPKKNYLVIDTQGNRFTLMAGADSLRSGICSTGSFVQLKSHDEREWLFKTPRGRFQIQEKRTNPVWSKPDWAFIEEGLPVPPPGAAERYERNVLGDYALSIGDGYLIHGTLYKRQLGQPVTHGCVRLGDDDLDAIFHSLELGSLVYIY